MLIKYETQKKDAALRVEFEYPGMKVTADMEMRARKLLSNIVKQVI
jgi:hypothetical protein